MALNPQDQFFKFVDEEKMGFINAERKGPLPRQKAKSASNNDCPIIYDKRGREPEKKEYQLTETGGFIMTFVMQQVARDLIAQLYSSEYGVNLAEAAAKVDGFIDDLITNKQLLTTKTKHRLPEVPPAIRREDTFRGIKPVDIGVGTNQVFHYIVGYVI